MNLSELSEFCRRMGVGLRAGVDVLKLLQNEQKSGSTKHRQTMAAVDQRVRAGDTLAEAMKAQGKYFPNLLVQMVHASEIGGRTESIFAYMAQYYEQLKQTRSMFFQKISWPMIQLFMAIGIIGVVILIQGLLSPNSTYDASSIGLRGVNGFIVYCTAVSLAAAAIGTLLWGNLEELVRLSSVLDAHRPAHSAVGDRVSDVGA